MAGVASSDMTDFRLASVPVRKVTSSTRFVWSKHEVSTFESFVREHRITSTSQKKKVDLQALLSALHLDRFMSLDNSKGEALRPIIETKVQRKLASVITNLQQEQYAASAASLGQDKTRLQAARTRAIAAGEEPPTSLPCPDPIYTPDIWKTKARKPGTISTVEKAKAEVVRLERALTLARAKLSLLEQQEQAGLDEQLSEQQQQEEERRRRHDKKKEPRATLAAVVNKIPAARVSPISTSSLARSHDRDTTPATTPTSEFEFESETSSDDGGSDSHVAGASRTGSAPQTTADPASRKALLTFGRSERHGSTSKNPNRALPSKTLPDPLLHNSANIRHGNGSKAPPLTSPRPELPQNLNSTDAGRSQHRNKTIRVRRLGTKDLTLVPSRGLQNESGDESDRELTARLKRMSDYFNDKYGKTGRIGEE